MSDYTSSELLSEVSKLFRGGLNPGRTGGSLNTETEYQQLLEMTAVTMLLTPDAVFYVARLAANQLNAAVTRESAVLEDILVALDDLGQLGDPVRDTTSLSNARTAVLSLDAAESISGRPETQRFTRQMDTFAEQVRRNVYTSARTSLMARTKEEARSIIRTNLDNLSSLHGTLLDRLFSLKECLNEFLAQDLPSKVSTSVLAAVSARLQDLASTIETNSNTDNLAASRQMFLETLANKIGVKALAEFKDPSDLKYRSPNRPIPSTLRHYGRVTGAGVPASFTTSAGPWELPISGVLSLSVGGAAQEFHLEDVKGAALVCRNSQAYQIQADSSNLHVVVDPQAYDGTVSSATTSSIILNEFLELGFKHLGTLVSFLTNADSVAPGGYVDLTGTDLYTRFITELRLLQTAVPPGLSLSGSVLTATTFNPGEEGAIGFQSGHVGCYLKDPSNQRFEILEVLSSTQCVIETRGLTPNLLYLQLRGQFSSKSGTTRFNVLPALDATPAVGSRLRIGPTVKTTSLTVGARSVANLISDIGLEAGDLPAAQEGGRLVWHVSPEAASGDSTKLALRIRTKLNPYLQVSQSFVRPQYPVGAPRLVGSSAHKVLGLYEGELDTSNLLTPSELSALINANPLFEAEVVTTELAAGFLETVPLTAQVVDVDGQNLAALGVQDSDQIEISNGTVAGTYRVTSAVLSTLTLVADAFSTKESALAYRVFREQVKISNASSLPGASLTVVDAPSELGLIEETRYGTISSFEAVDKLGNNLSFSAVEVGDYLKVAGLSEVKIAAVPDINTLELESGLPSTVNHVQFEIRSGAARAYDLLSSDLSTFVESSNLLKKNKFDEGVEAIEVACTTATLAGQNFLSSRNQAKGLVSDLLTTLTYAYPRQSEYSATVAAKTGNLASVLETYEVPDVESVDNVLAALRDRNYERAADLLRSAKFTDFFSTTEETGSYAGYLMATSRTAIKDLPPESRSMFDFLDKRDLAKATRTLTDAETDFSDTENEPEDLDL